MKRLLSSLAVACVAVAVSTGATLIFAGSGPRVAANIPTDFQQQIVDRPAQVRVADEVTAHAKSISVLPASGEASATVSSPMKVSPQAAVAKDSSFSRRNPVVEAVNRTKNAIVMIRVPRSGGGKDMIGTGVIVDKHGFIVTNRHVIGDAKTVFVVLADETKIEADVVVGEARYDLAILRIYTKKQLTALPLAPVDDLMVGESVIAVGHPFGYSHSVSTGIVSALNREITMPSGDVLTALIQTNASINPGNSGGPLLNINGEFIGVNVALREGAQNIAFAINAGTVKNFVRQHLSSARVAGVQHGLQCGEKILAETGDRQRLVVSWFQGEGVLRQGDELVSVGGQQVGNTFDLERAFWNKKPGESVQLTVIRQGQEMNVALTVVASNGAGQTASLPRAVSQPAATPVTAAAASQR